MSKHSSSDSVPDFVDRHDYSDILGTALPPTPKSPDRVVESALFDDPWGEPTPEDIAQRAKIPPQPKRLSSKPVSTSDPLTSGAASTATSGATQQRQTEPTARPQPVAVTAPPIVKPQIETQSPPVKVAPTPAPVVNPQETSVTGKDLALQYCKRGSNSLAAKDYAAARSAYKIAIEWDPQLAIAHSGAAQVCFQIQDYEGALLAWDRAIALAPENLDFCYQRAAINKLLKNYFPVLADCKRILEASPDRSDARWLNAVALVKVEHYQLALASLDLHIKAYPKDPNGYCYRGICYERLEQLNLALADFDRAIALQANQPVFHHARGRTRQKLGDLKGALVDFNLTIERKPQAAVYDDRAEVNRCLGNHLEALDDCDRAIELNPRSIDTYYRRGLTYAMVGELDLSLENYTQVIDLNGAHLNAYIQRSWIYFRKHEYRQAKQDCQSVKSLDANCFWAYYLQGVVDNFSDLKHNALKNLSKAIDLQPNYVSARYHRGCVYHEMGDLKKAMADFEQARLLQDRGLERLVDRDETGFYAEGLALYHMGQSEAARTVLILGALSAKRFNNPSFHKKIQQQIEQLGMASGELSDNASNSCNLR